MLCVAALVAVADFAFLGLASYLNASNNNNSERKRIENDVTKANTTATTTTTTATAMTTKENQEFIFSSRFHFRRS